MVVVVVVVVVLVVVVVDVVVVGGGAGSGAPAAESAAASAEPAASVTAPAVAAAAGAGSGAGAESGTAPTGELSGGATVVGAVMTAWRTPTSPAARAGPVGRVAVALAVVGPLRTAPYAVQDVVVRGRAEHIVVTWKPALATDVTSYALRFRRVGDPTWVYRSAASTATTASLTTWPAAMPAGTYAVQIGARHLGAAVPSIWSTTTTVAVSALHQRAAASSTVLRPYVDGVADSIRFAASSSWPTTGVVRILTSNGRLVRTVPLARGTAWATAWTGRDSHGRLVAGGTYRADVRLVGRGVVANRVALLTFTVVPGRARVAS